MGLLLGMVLVLGYPLLPSSRSLGRAGRVDPTVELRQRKEQVYAAIKEIEFDHALGKLAEEEYRRQRQQLESEAISLLRLLDLVQGGGPTSVRVRVREDVQRLRQRRGKDEGRCPGCGAQCRPQDRFCAQCGAALARGAEA
jgi:hypothetical protein